jgi:hypothetical protein
MFKKRIIRDIIKLSDHTYIKYEKMRMSYEFDDLIKHKLDELKRIRSSMELKILFVEIDLELG